jgi:ribose-phosphate pyrophosphokinase
VRLDEPVRGHEVFLLAAPSPPVNDHLVELLAIADACRRADAARVVALIPYFGYARSDRRDGRRTPIMTRLVAELTERAGIDHVITIDVHTPALEGFFRVPVDNLTAVPVLAAALQRRPPLDAVIVAPDVGALRLANRYATILDLPVAVCHKQRLGGAEVRIARVTGDVAERQCIIVDDMISTGATIVEAMRALADAGARPHPTVAVTHAVFSPGALEKLASARVGELFVTDTIAPRAEPDVRLVPHVVSIAPLVSTAVHRLVEGGSLRELS